MNPKVAGLALMFVGAVSSYDLISQNNKLYEEALSRQPTLNSAGVEEARNIVKEYGNPWAYFGTGIGCVGALLLGYGSTREKSS